MQYLLKITLQNTELWRLIAVDGIADRAFVAQLIALAFGYRNKYRAFVVGGREYSAGYGGEIKSGQEMASFDDFHLKQDGEFIYRHDTSSDELHDVRILKAEEKLHCLMPSCLVGAGYVPPDLEIGHESVNKYLDRDDCPSLNLREVTQRMRTFGLRRGDAHSALLNAGAAPLNFKTD